jgi:hypothetical protein
MALKLGKGSAFVKSRLRRLPQSDDVWEADFLPQADHWMGLVVEQEHGAVFAMKMLEAAPSVNDLAHLLSDAMYTDRCMIAGTVPEPSGCTTIQSGRSWCDIYTQHRRGMQ